MAAKNVYESAFCFFLNSDHSEPDKEIMMLVILRFWDSG